MTCVYLRRKVVVLADASDSLRNDQQAYSKPGSKKGIDALVDADAIFCYQCVRKMNEQAHVVVEIVLHTNVGYLDPVSKTTTYILTSMLILIMNVYSYSGIASEFRRCGL